MLSCGETSSGRYPVLQPGSAIRRDGRDDVAHPAEQAARPDPEAWRHDQPEQPAKEVAVVELSDAGHDQAEHRGEPRVFQLLSHHAVHDSGRDRRERADVIASAAAMTFAYYGSSAR